MRKLSKRSTAVIAGVAIVVIGGGAAFAAQGWTIDGAGKADGKAAEIKDLSASSTFGANLYPGVKVSLATKFKNPNEFPVVLTGAIAVKSATVAPADATCSTALTQGGMFTTTFPGTEEIAPGEKDVTSEVTIGDIPEECAGKKIRVEYTFDGLSKAA
jgi:hypothetical protein